jgi:hypothetical protein
MSEQRIETAKRTAVGYRNYRRARDRALTKLSQLYPDTYKELLEREKANDEAEGRKWLDIDGTTNAPIASVSAKQFTAGQSSNLSSNQGNDGGEA